MLKRQLSIFLIVGSLATLIDFLFYRGLVGFNVTSIDLAKGISFLIGTLFAYIANRFLTFKSQSNIGGSLWRFILLYSLTLMLNVAINALMLKWLAHFNLVVLFAFVLATSFSAFCNFIGMKYFVFKSGTHEIRT